MKKLPPCIKCLLVLGLFMASCEQSITPQPSPTGTESRIPIAKPSSSQLPPSPAPVIHNPAGPVYETLFQIPVGPGGIRYNELSIPNALTMLPDGTLIIADPTDNRLLHYNMSGELLSEIELYQLNIANVSDLVATPKELYLLEISYNVAPERFRVSRLTFDGELIAQYDIPVDHRWDAGLYGLGPVDDEGGIVLEFYGETFRYYQLVDALGGNSGELTGISIYGRLYEVIFGNFSEPRRNPAIFMDEVKVESQVTLSGLIKILAVNPDGSFYVIREDVVSDSPVIQGDITVHFLSEHGIQLGVARYPLSEWLSFVQRQVAVGPDGEVYALLPRQDTANILRLNFYPSIEPLIAGGLPPIVGKGESTP